MKILQLPASSSHFLACFEIVIGIQTAHLYLQKLPGVRHLKAHGRCFRLGFVV